MQEQQITDIHAEGKKALEAHFKKWWWIFAIGFVGYVFVIAYWTQAAVPLLFYVLVPILAGYYLYFLEMYESLFWKQFAKREGFTYKAKADLIEVDLPEDLSLAFKGTTVRKARHLITGRFNGRELRSFIFDDRDFESKRRRRYAPPHHILAFRFNGQFPHIFLDRLGDDVHPNAGVPVPLPGEFAKKFRLLCPPEYELEALQIFTPDIPAFILDSGWKYDVELVGQDLLFWFQYPILSIEELEKKFGGASALANKLAPALDKFKYERIGQYTDRLIDRPMPL